MEEGTRGWVVYIGVVLILYGPFLAAAVVVFSRGSCGESVANIAAFASIALGIGVVYMEAARACK